MKFITKKDFNEKCGTSRLKLCCIWLLSLELAVMAAYGETVSLQQDSINDFSGDQPYDGVSDTYLSSSGNDRNFGASDLLLAGQDSNGSEVRHFTGLLRFNVESLAPIAKNIQSVTLKLWGRAKSWPEQTHREVEIGLFPVAPMNAGWIEGKGNNAAVVAGEPNWNSKAEPDENWKGGARGASVAGVDCAETPVATLHFATDDPEQFYTFSLPVALVQDWINNPSSNGGLAFILVQTDAPADEGAFIEFRSSQDVQDTRPELIVEYKER